MLLLEKLEKSKEAAEALNEAIDELLASFDEINEAMDSTETDLHVRDLISKMISDNDPILDQGTPVIDSVDFIIETLPEEPEEEISDGVNC